MKMTMGNETRDASLSLLRLLLPPPIGGGGGEGEERRVGGRKGILEDSLRILRYVSDGLPLFFLPPPLPSLLYRVDSSAFQIDTKLLSGSIRKNPRFQSELIF